jgi:hypothetical protein
MIVWQSERLLAFSLFLASLVLDRFAAVVVPLVRLKRGHLQSVSALLSSQHLINALADVRTGGISVILPRGNIEAQVTIPANPPQNKTFMAACLSVSLGELIVCLLNSYDQKLVGLSTLARLQETRDTY